MALHPLREGLHPLVHDKAHSVDNQRKPCHNRASEDCTKTNHQHPAAKLVYAKHELVLKLKAEDEVAERGDKRDNKDQVRQRLSWVEVISQLLLNTGKLSWISNGLNLTISNLKS